MRMLKRWAADCLRRIADRLDWEGAPKIMRWSFTFEDHIGIRFREDGRGCPLAYLGDTDYDRAFTEAGTAPGHFGWTQVPASHAALQQPPDSIR